LISLWIIFSGIPASSHDIPLVTVKELKEMIDRGAEVIVVDNRPKTEFDKQHVPKTMSLPWDMDLSEEIAQKMPKDKNKLIVTYCDCGPGEADSVDVANQLIKAGYTHVKTLADGWSAWAEAGYPVESGKKK